MVAISLRQQHLYIDHSPFPISRSPILPAIPGFMGSRIELRFRSVVGVSKSLLRSGQRKYTSAPCIIYVAMEQCRHFANMMSAQLPPLSLTRREFILLGSESFQ